MGVITTCFCPVGTSSGNTYIQNYQEDTLVYRYFIYKWDLVGTNDRFLL